MTDATVKSITVNGDIVGGSSGATSGGIDGGLTSTFQKVTIGGDIESRGTNIRQGFVRALSIDNILVKGDVIASSGLGSGTRQIDGLNNLGKVVIGGSLIGNATNRVEIISDTLTSLLVGRNAEFAEIAVTDSDATLKKLTVNGAWISSRFAMASDSGADDIFGTNDDPAFAGNATASVAKIIINGQVTGTFGGTDSYLIRAPKIGSLTVAGTKIPFASGEQSFSLSITGDVSATDVA
ncbi:MAG: hypothetical protein EOP83_17050 [Verrucomicrobiaceae bacterium]|nr:MAG: hypothetical protein EOP83_17050 [Verrucomicrobiaceae bacterium]